MTEPWMRWVFGHHEAAIATWVNAPRTLVGALEAGAGRSVLPAAAGETGHGLVRSGDPIATLTHDTWIVSHDDDRRQPEIRLVLDRLAQLLEDNRQLFAPHADPA